MNLTEQLKNMFEGVVLEFFTFFVEKIGRKHNFTEEDLFLSFTAGMHLIGYIGEGDSIEDRLQRLSDPEKWYVDIEKKFKYKILEYERKHNA